MHMFDRLQPPADHYHETIGMTAHSAVQTTAPKHDQRSEPPQGTFNNVNIFVCVPISSSSSRGLVLCMLAQFISNT